MMSESLNATILATPYAGTLPPSAVKVEGVAEKPEPDMLTMFSAALTEIINKAVDKRVESILGTLAAAQFMSTEFDERVKRIVGAAIEEHTCEEPHQDAEDVVHDALAELDLSSHVEKALKYEVNWEDMVDERVREQVEELVPSDDELHDKIREVINDVTFTVSVD
jgi:AAA+ ATPase superfamily predicted ATPase